MLPKSVYEALPYTNLAIGAVIIYRYDTVLLTLSGVLFFAVGAFMWAMRSYNRRTNQHSWQYDYGDFNRNWYEFKPFFYMLFGLLAVNRLESSILAMLGMIVGLYGLYLIILRSLHRHLTTPGRHHKRKSESEHPPQPLSESVSEVSKDRAAV